MDRRTLLKVIGTSSAGLLGGMRWPRALTAVPRADVLAKPTPGQQAWQDYELGLFVHFDVYPYAPDWKWRTFKNLPDPDVYQPHALDVDQWMEAARAFGARYAVLVAKHCSGFLQWQSDLYPYGVRQSSWRDGKGDLVEEFVDGCARHGIAPGIYASVAANAWWEVDNPGLVNRGAGGDPEKQAAYNRICEQMMTELWSRYGSWAEIWFDGGAIPVEEGGPDLLPILARYQPDAMVFQGPAGTIRWVGNEDGVADYPCWATVSELNDKGAGDPDGHIWQPAECDVPLRREEWFWKPDQEHLLYSADELVDMYYRSVGRNCNLLINANPDPSGRIPDADFERYQALGDEIRARFSNPVAVTQGSGEVLELALPDSRPIDHVVLMEDISLGERVRRYEVEGRRPEGQWKPLCAGTAIGHKRIEKIDPTEVSRIRLRCLEYAAEPHIREMAVYAHRT